MSESQNENEDVGLISDDELPEDLQPGEDLEADEEEKPDDPLPEG